MFRLGGLGAFCFPGLFLKVGAVHGLGYFIIAIPLATLNRVLEHFSRRLGSLFVLTNFRDFLIYCHGIYPFWPATFSTGRPFLGGRPWRGVSALYLP